MKFELGQKIIDKIRGKKKNSSSPKIDTVYPKIYPPYYNQTVEISNFVPDLYNKNGRKMDIFFIRDMHCAHSPYMAGSDYFLWDRFNIGLKTHFYTHTAMLETMGKPTNKYGWLIESPSITPNDYKIFDTHEGLEKDFDRIFTYDTKLLNTLRNASFLPVTSVWYGTRDNSRVKISSSVCALKEKNISMLCSNKQLTEFHKIRHTFAKEFAETNLGDLFGAFQGGKYIEHKEDTLETYRYHIAIENGVFDYYFTEKILDCFASMTVPIYLGANKIDEFFNPEGIIKIHTKDLGNLHKILMQCSQHDYEQRLPAIKDNFAKVQKYINLNNYMYEKYFL